jgi:hypothetical protein
MTTSLKPSIDRAVDTFKAYWISALISAKGLAEKPVV